MREIKLLKAKLGPMEMIIRRLAGTMILVSLVLAHVHSRYWLLLTAFVGLNLLQSSFTGFCPAEMIFRRLGIGVSCRSKRKNDSACV